MIWFFILFLINKGKRVEFMKLEFRTTQWSHTPVHAISSLNTNQSKHLFISLLSLSHLLSL